jgi:glycosyltransferase involved in cell wall biosynthesis
LYHLMFLNRQFGIGGAERQLIELLKYLDKEQFNISVVTFYENGSLQSEVEVIPGIQLINLKKKGRYDILTFVRRLWHVVITNHPHILHGYLDSANVLALLMGRLSGAKVVWAIGASNMNPARYNWAFRLSLTLQDVLGRYADLVINNSYAGQNHFLARGFPSTKMIVIPNGIDICRLQPNMELRRYIRAEWKIAEHEKLIGVVGRLDPMKDYPNFLRAAAFLMQQRSDIRFVCVGDGPAQYREELQKLAQELGLADCVIWAGARNDIAAVYNAFDIAASSSQWGEGLPYAIAEAMACGVPCVVTDVGDLAMLVDDTGIVVPPGDPQALAAGWKSLLEEPERLQALGAAARERIVSEFGVDVLARRTEEALSRLLMDR